MLPLGCDAAQRRADRPVRGRYRPRFRARLADVTRADSAENADYGRQRVRGAWRTARGDGRRAGAANNGPAVVPEDLCRPAELFLHRLPAQREGLIDRTAPV